MRDDIRDRFFTPFVLPVTIIGVMLLIGFSLSRVLLAVSEISASLVAVLAAGYILAMAFFVEARRRIPARTLGVALAVGLIALVGAGAVANAAGIRALHEEAGEGGEAAGGEGEEGGGTEPLFVAIDIAYEQAPETLPIGTTTITLEDRGAIEHNVVFEELGDLLIVEAAAGETETGDVTLEEPGEYTYYCSVPGHREAGMEGTLTAEEGAAAPSGEAGGSSEAASDGAGAGSEAASEDAAGAGSEAASEPASAAGGSES
jgi:plastocyanin